MAAQHPQQLNLAPLQQQAAASGTAFVPMRTMFNSWPLPGAFGGMQAVMGVPGFATAASAPGTGAATPAWAGNAPGAPGFFNPFSQQATQQQLPPPARQPSQQQQQLPPPVADGVHAGQAMTGVVPDPAAVSWGAPKPQAAAAELQMVLGRYAQAADAVGSSLQQPQHQQQQQRSPPQEHSPPQQQPQVTPDFAAQMMHAEQQEQQQLLQRPFMATQFPGVQQGLNLPSGGSEFSHASDPMQVCARQRVLQASMWSAGFNRFTSSQCLNKGTRT